MEIKFKEDVETIYSKNRLKEEDYIEYCEKQGYVMYKSYKPHITNFYEKREFENNPNIFKLNGIDNIDKRLIDLFKKYKLGYPDFVLIKDGKISFIELKIERDGLSLDQIIFLNELSQIANVKVVNFYNTNKDPQPSKNITEEKEFRAFVKKLRNRCTAKKYNKYWIIAKSYEKYEKKLFRKEYTGMLSKISGIPKNSIIWYLNKNGEDILNKKSDKKNT